MMKINFDRIWNRGEVNAKELIAKRSFFVVYDLNDIAVFEDRLDAESCARAWLTIEADQIGEWSWKEVQRRADFDRPASPDLYAGDVALACCEIDDDFEIDGDDEFAVVIVEKDRWGFGDFVLTDEEIFPVSIAYSIALADKREQGRARRADRRAAKKAAKAARKADALKRLSMMEG